MQHSPDDTTLPVLDPGRGRTKTGRLWCYAVDNRPWCGPGHPAAVYIYSDDRKGVHPAEHLKGYSGLVQVDGYAGFDRLVTAPAGEAPQLAFCWAHNLESVFMWGSRAEDAAWPTISPRRTPDKFASLASLAVCGRTSLQIPLRTASTADAYVRNHEWRDARLPGCPLHQMGGCSFARHGSYPRATPRGCRIARWYCPESHRTFSLLPDFLAARLPGLLASIEDDIAVASSCKSMEAAADVLRGPDITLAAAIRWLRRRVQAVRAALEATARFVLNLSDCILGEEFARGVNAGRAHTLCDLRRSLPPQALNCIPAPLGFQSSRYTRPQRDDDQHDVWPD